MPAHELESFLETWEANTRNIVRTLETLPATQYDFRPTPDWRSLGEMGWHLAEIEAYTSLGIERGEFSFSEKPPGVERPREIAGLAKGYERIHADARVRILALEPSALDRTITFFDGRPLSVRDILWNATLHHSIHHLGELVLMCRMAGGTPPGLYGPNRETTAEMKAAAMAKR